MQDLAGRQTRACDGHELLVGTGSVEFAVTLHSLCGRSPAGRILEGFPSPR